MDVLGHRATAELVDHDIVLCSIQTQHDSEVTCSQMNARVLIAAADSALRTNLAALFLGPQIDMAERPVDVLDLLARNSSLRLLILAESNGDGQFTLELLEAARARRPDVAVLLVGGRPSIEHSAEAIRHGAEDVVPIPYCEEALRKEVARILETADLRDRLQALRQMVPRRNVSRPIISRSVCMQRVLARAEAAARNDTPVLITGETGTGKELVARAIHGSSRRAQKPFVPIPTHRKLSRPQKLNLPKPELP